MTTRVLVLGASGQIALHVLRSLQGNTAIHPMLFLRDAGKLSHVDTTGMAVIEGDASDETALAKGCRPGHRRRQPLRGHGKPRTA